ncbi:MAG TPA: NAD(P)H-dependent oxidoreductase [Chitinophagales bacterium]|nr:NAD(P)H-dependent oxidoreductase [Chitinophagales bacterium]HMV02196.1 NAD(P)H-dependent oxidoreductase [Chitinophagales bacterium]HMW94873.1 NAD(P)H-dependent oxidoreductase [Chitinophagales bacterium]HNB39558.1 NAD(P)H-dependent oxidoreductase [Chitinophagales bacterium]HND46374.1 NAD(P)H-dependent oxidoreductase [Chitinophagales bacterium]
MTNLKIITSTSRTVGNGKYIAKWITELAQQSGLYNVELLDLAEINLPFMDEANHPMAQKYELEHTKAWSKKINEADAFIFVLAEYNFGIPATIKNAMDYLHFEWKYKPVGIVSYGGISAGLRSAQMFKQVVTSFNMMPIVEQVAIPFFFKSLDNEGKFNADEMVQKSANVMLNELKRWSDALAVLRK